MPTGIPNVAHGGFEVSGEELERDEKNAIYDRVTTEIWRLAVYQPVHAGREFTNIAGAPLLDSVATACQLGADQHVLELCSGTGAVGRYLSSRYGCAVTGVELNQAQIDHARQARAAAGPDAARVSFVQDDVTRWQPDRLYDLALIVDSLTLLPEPTAVLRTVRRALRSGGWFAFADTVAGPAISAETVGRTWDLDGIRPLPGPDALVELLTSAGLADVRLTEMTDVAVACFSAISAALRERSREITAVVTPDEYDEWRTSTEFYLDSYRNGQLTYWRGMARRPSRATAAPLTDRPRRVA